MADLSIDSNISGTLGSNISGSLGSVGPVTLSGIPDTYTFKWTELPKINIGVDPLEGKLEIEPIELELKPIETALSIKEIPSVRAHLPANYAVVFSLFGVEVGAIRLCGEGQVITEPYRPNPCEVCGVPTITDVGPDTPVAGRRS